MQVWDMFLTPERRTFQEIQNMVRDFIQRTHGRQVSLQIQNRARQDLPHTRQGTSKVCPDWLKHGYCQKKKCAWLHPEDQKGPQQAKAKVKPKKDKQPTQQQPHLQYDDQWYHQPWPQWTTDWTTGGAAQAATKAQSTTDPKKACRFYAAGLCTKSHQQCDFVHNPTCWNYREWGECPAGGNCLFPHRDGSGALVKRTVPFPDKGDAQSAALVTLQQQQPTQQQQATKPAGPKHPVDPATGKRLATIAVSSGSDGSKAQSGTPTTSSLQPDTLG